MKCILTAIKDREHQQHTLISYMLHCPLMLQLEVIQCNLFNRVRTCNAKLSHKYHKRLETKDFMSTNTDHMDDKNKKNHRPYLKYVWVISTSTLFLHLLYCSDKLCQVLSSHT